MSTQTAIIIVVIAVAVAVILLAIRAGRPRVTQIDRTVREERDDHDA